MNTSTGTSAPRFLLTRFDRSALHHKRRLILSAWLATVFCSLVLPARSDVLLGTNGDRITGKVVQETAESVVFDSELGGRLIVPRAQVRTIQRTNSIEPGPIPSGGEAISNAQAPTNLPWGPPVIGHDQADWIQLKSGEWLKGRLQYIQHRKVEFDSDELKDLSLDLKDVRQVYPVNPFFTKFDGREQIYGVVVISNDVVRVSGPEQVSLPREQLTGITPGGNRELDFWSGNLDISLAFQSGNTRQATLGVSAELARRTPSTVVQLNYLGNYGQTEGVKNANNHRLDGIYDVRLNRHWFLRPVYLDYYKDELANIAHQATVAVGGGYFIFDRDGLEWTVSGGPGYQHTKFLTVEEGASDTASTPAGVLQTKFKVDITRRLKFLETISVFLTSQDAGSYSHHAVSTLEFEIKRHLDLNVSFVWDYLKSPQTDSSGALPKHSDFRLNVGIGVKF